MSLPSVAGVSRCNRTVFDGRLPSKVRCATSQSGDASARTSSGVLPKASFALREDVGEQHVMLFAQRVQRLAEGDKVARDQTRPLVDQLIERVLAVGTRLTPINRAGVAADGIAVERHVLAVALHRQLLEIGGEPLQILLAGKYADRLRPEKVIVPDRQEAHQDRQV